VGTIWPCHIAVSLDGMIARPDGAFDWLEGHPTEAFGLEQRPIGLNRGAVQPTGHKLL
jgi:hypothetical protein